MFHLHPSRVGRRGETIQGCHISATGSVLGGSVLKRKIKVTTGQSVHRTHPQIKTSNLPPTQQPTTRSLSADEQSTEDAQTHRC